MSGCPVRHAMRRLSTRAGLADPHPIFAELREAAPLHDAPHFGPVVTRHQDVRAVLFDRSLKVSSDAASPGTARADIAKNLPEDLRALPAPLFLQDEPSHGRLRGLIVAAFSWREVQKLAPFIQRTADALLDDLASRRRLDVVADYAVPLPMRVIARVLGVEDETTDRFRTWSEDIIHELHSLASTPELERAIAAHRELAHFFRAQIAKRRQRPRDDLIGRLVAAEERGALSEDEIVSLCVNLLVAGHITTSDLIGILIHLLLRFPGELAKLRSNPSLWPQAVEEALRFEPPTPMLARVHACPAHLHGRTFAPGDSINLFIAPANRDPRLFEAAERFDVDREDNPHLSFGGGGHYCIGASLARLEAEIAVRALFARRPALALTERAPSWRATPNFRGLAELIVDAQDLSRASGPRRLTMV